MSNSDRGGNLVLNGQNSNSDIEEMKRQLDQLQKRIETLASKE